MNRTNANAKALDCSAALHNLLETRDKKLAAIATEHFGVETLDTRKSDSLDFHDVAVWSMKAALEAAFAAGQKSERK